MEKWIKSFKETKTALFFLLSQNFKYSFLIKSKKMKPGMHCYLNTSSTANFPIGIGFGSII